MRIVMFTLNNVIKSLEKMKYGDIFVLLIILVIVLFLKISNAHRKNIKGKVIPNYALH